MVQHNSVDIFKLSDAEWEEALKNHPHLKDNNQEINYYQKTANAWIEPRKDHYFDNAIILKQFERLFILTKYKKEFKNCEIELLVDNATTHTSKIYDVNQFNKFPGTNCIYQKFEWQEKEQVKR